MDKARGDPRIVRRRPLLIGTVVGLAAAGTALAQGDAASSWARAVPAAARPTIVPISRGRRRTMRGPPLALSISRLPRLVGNCRLVRHQQIRCSAFTSDLIQSTVKRIRASVRCGPQPDASRRPCPPPWAPRWPRRDEAPVVHAVPPCGRTAAAYVPAMALPVLRLLAAGLLGYAGYRVAKTAVVAAERDRRRRDWFVVQDPDAVEAGKEGVPQGGGAMEDDPVVAGSVDPWAETATGQPAESSSDSLDHHPQPENEATPNRGA